MKKIEAFFNNKKTFITIIVLSMCYLFGFMSFGTGYKHFWYDEMATIGFMRTGVSFGEMVGYYLDIEASNLPLFQIIVSVFYRNLPANAFFVLLPTMAFTIAGLIFTILLANKISGRFGAYSVILISIFSTTVVNRMGLLYRTYSFVFFSVALTLYLIEIIKDDYNFKNIVKLTISLLLLVYSHYFGTLMFGMLLLSVLFYAFVKKKGLKRIIPFVITGALFVPWFLLAMRTRVASVDNFWIESPKITKTVETIGYLLGGNIVATLVWGISFLVMVFILVKRKQIVSIKGLIVLMPVIIIGMLFVYSNFGGSLYEDRYFIILLPELFLTIAMFFQEVLDGLREKRVSQLVIIVQMIILFVIAFTEFNRCKFDMLSEYVRYDGAAQYIIDANDISNPDTLLVIREFSDVDEVVSCGWYDYYLYRQNYVASNLVIKSSGDNDQTEIIDSYGDKINKVYVFAPEDLIGYNGDTFEQTFYDYLYKLAVFERVKEE